MNAIKNGLYCSRVIIETGDGREDRSELEALRKAMEEHFAPVGAYEYFLLEKVVSLEWRLLRSARAEAGDIRRFSDAALYAQQMSVKGNAIADIRLGHWRSNSAAIEYAIKMLEGARALADKGTEIPALALKQFGGLRGDFDIDDPIEECIKRNERWNEAKKSSPEKANQAQRELIEFLAATINCCKGLLSEQIQREERLAEADLQSNSIPHQFLFERILRYQAGVDRQLARALAQLEAAQERRKARCATSVPINGRTNRENE